MSINKTRVEQKNETLTPSKAKKLLINTIAYNLKNNTEKIAINIEGLPGIAKTSVCKQAVQSFNELLKNKKIDKEIMYIKWNLAQYTPEDLLGYPKELFEVIKETQNEKDVHRENKWIPEKAIQFFLKDGFTLTGRSRTTYSPPEDLEEAISSNTPVVLNLDDFNRGGAALMNAVMEISEEQSYGKWKLPEGSSVILTSNPDDGDFNVSINDSAQKTRMLIYEMVFSLKDWMSFSEEKGLPFEFTSFIQSHPEVIEGNGVTKTSGDDNEDSILIEKPNIRIWTKYFNICSSAVEKYQKDGLMDDLINTLSIFAGKSIPLAYLTMLVSHVKGLLDGVPSIEEIIHSQNIEKTINQVKSRSLNPNGQIRTDYTGVVYRRILNFGKSKESENLSDSCKQNLIEFMKSDILGLDLKKNILTSAMGKIPNLRFIATDKDLLKVYGKTLSV